MLQVFRTRPRRRARLSIERAELVLPLQHTAGRQKRTQQRVITEHLVLFAIYHYIYLLLRLIPDCPKREDTLHLGTRVCVVPCSWMVPLVWRARKITIFFRRRRRGPAVGARHMCCVQRRDTHKDAACVLCKLSHEQPQTLYDIQRCEAPQQPKSRRRGIIECRFCTLASLARRDGLYARRTPRHFDRSRASGQLRKWASGLTQRSGRERRAF